MKHLNLLFFYLTLYPFSIQANDSTPDLPHSHRIYETIDRFETRGWLDNPIPRNRPFSRKQAVHILIQILKRIDSGSSLTSTERGILDRHKREFAHELAKQGYIQSPPSRDPVGNIFKGEELFSWRDTIATAVIGPIFRQRILFGQNTGVPQPTVSQTYVGLTIRGTYGNSCGFYLRHFEAREWSSRYRTTRSNVVARPIEEVQFKGKIVDFREAIYQLSWSSPRFALDIGKGSLNWGPGQTGNLFLTNHAPSFSLARLRVSYGRVAFVHIVGFLRSRAGLIDTTKTRLDNDHRRTLLRRKHISAHRLEITISKNISLGLQEAVIYGDRNPEILYLSPISVLTAAQSYLGNTDNLMVGADLSLQPGSNLKIYLALTFDDLQKFSPGAFANKFAFQSGFLWINPLFLKDTDLRVEFIHLEPFVYSHNFQINTYEHFDALLGYPLGPNADRIYGQIVHRFSPALSLSLTFDRERQGQNHLDEDGSLVNVGGNASQGRRPFDSATRHFLSGIVESRMGLGISLTYEPIQNFQMNLQHKLDRSSNIQIPGKIRGNTTSHLWTVTTDFNFF